MRPAVAAGQFGAPALTRVVACCLITLGLIVWFGNIGYRTLAQPDEARYAEIAREMLVSGDWVSPHLNGIPYFEKPPLQYWATALAYSIFGVSPWVARLWAACLGLLGIVITYATTRALWGKRAAEFAAVILASFPLYFVITHLNTLDGALAFFLNAAICAFVMAQRLNASSDSQRHWMYLCWFSIALGFLQKGLVALALPFLSLVVYSLAFREWRLWRQLHLLDGLLILAAITLPWIVLAAQRNPGFLQFFFVHEHFTRFATTLHERYEPWWYFIAILGVGVLPWVVPTVRAAIDALRPARAISLKPASPKAVSPEPERVLLTWAVVQLVFFSFSGSKLAPYIVPMAPPLAMLTARWLSRHGTARSLLPVSAISTAMSLAWIATPWLLPRFMLPGIELTTYLQVAEWAPLAGFAGLACIVFHVMAARADDLRLAVIALAASVSVPLAIVMCGSNSLDRLRGRPEVAEVIAPHLTADTPFFCVGMYWQALPLALDRTCVAVAYRGELELQFDPLQENHLPTLTAFAERWRNEPSAVAIVAPRLWPQITAAGLEPRTVMHDENVVVLVKP